MKDFFESMKSIAGVLQEVIKYLGGYPLFVFVLLYVFLLLLIGYYTDEQKIAYFLFILHILPICAIIVYVMEIKTSSIKKLNDVTIPISHERLKELREKTVRFGLAPEDMIFAHIELLIESQEYFNQALIDTVKKKSVQ